MFFLNCGGKKIGKNKICLKIKEKQPFNWKQMLN